MTPLISVPDTEQQRRLLADDTWEDTVCMLDLRGRILACNAAAERQDGWKNRQILGEPFHRFFHPSEVAAGEPERILAIAEKQGRYEGEGWIIRKGATPQRASIVLTPMRDTAGKLLGFLKITRNLSERLLHMDRLRGSQQHLQQELDRFRITLQSIADGVITTDPTGLINYMNPVAEFLTGWNLASASGQDLEAVCHLIDPVSGDTLDNPVRTTLRDLTPSAIQEGGALLSRSGDMRDVQHSAAPIRTETGSLLGAVLVLQDVTSLRNVQREIAFSARHDALTLLPNRHQFEHLLEEALQDGGATGSSYIVCFLDLDRFKVINDTVGHSAGDALLRSVAHVLKQCVRSSDVVARLGGDEFALMLRGCNLEQAQATLNLILYQIDALPFVWEDRSFPISVSIGVTEAAPNCSSATVMKQADVACYAAKHGGRNRISIYHPERGEGYTRHLQMEIASDIRTAIAEDRFALHAQSIVSLRGDSAPHYEILIRMVDSEGGLIAPGHFIPAAERYDLMADVDRWVFVRIFQHYGAELSRIPDLQLSVNLSANSLNDTKFLAFFLDLIRDSPLSPSVLTVEITETSLINNLNAANTVIEAIRARGCKVALDDFGMGLCSFGYLRSFKVDCVKIDGSFVRNIINSSVDLAIVKSINSIAHEIGARTVAEFVENDSILALVRELRVDAAQGYGLGRPEPIESIFHPAFPHRQTCKSEPSRHPHAELPLAV